MAQLFKHLKVHQIFGANTDVGKTILTTGLLRASASRKRRVFYLKPVSTGPLEEADDRFVRRHLKDLAGQLSEACLFRYDQPVSPHLAVQLSKDKGLDYGTPDDAEFVLSVSEHIQRSAHAAVEELSDMYVETAGGVHSPTLSGTSQADAYRPLFLPTILVGDAKLGGISSTISAYESLLIRGFAVDAIVMFRDSYYRNWEYLSEYFADRGVKCFSVDPPPPKDSDIAKDTSALSDYYSEVIAPDSPSNLQALVSELDSRHYDRLTQLESMSTRAMETIWWPFVQHGLVKGPQDVMTVDSAWGDFFSTYESNIGSSGGNAELHHAHDTLLSPQLDGSASWWTQALGHSSPALTLAAASAAGRYGHVMFPQAVHKPALQLAEHLVHDGPGKGWASRAFFSDDGSTGMEIALKMALRAFAKRRNISDPSERKKLGILGLKGSYHGDTIGSMDACEEGVFTCEWHNAKGYWLDPPAVSLRQGTPMLSFPDSMGEYCSSEPTQYESIADLYDISSRLSSSLASQYTKYIEEKLDRIETMGHTRIAALVMEPLVMGVAGMVFVDPLFQRILVDVVRAREPSTISAGDWSGLPVIFDEVFVGMYRLGMESCAPVLGVTPDISVYAKILTGGLIPLAVTLANNSIFQAFLSERKEDALLHGHSYTAHPVGCEVANETFKQIAILAKSPLWQHAKTSWATPSKVGQRESAIWSFWGYDFISQLSTLDVVQDVMAMGTVLAVTIRDDAGGYASFRAQNLLAPLKTLSQDNTGPGGLPARIHFRTLGNVAYFMSNLNTPETVLRSTEKRIWESLSQP
ncbi:PLP-dependent transferase [Sistotremastrum suecicum HHB10207 ss-3]|uniref:PLP-dependent transferase n=1 Tax=Sistotremastrum suecicum HHB10207 ss-3 TaxID=1314776 RepID=A0A166G4L8_9AGAM|nr:PLP-dependent transferase [Sistotremastrum suecicum HHB10207 ss-3]